MIAHGCMFAQRYLLLSLSSDKKIQDGEHKKITYECRTREFLQVMIAKASGPRESSQTAPRSACDCGNTYK